MAVITVTDLNNYMRDYPTMRIEANHKWNIGLYDVVSDLVDEEKFLAGDKIEWLIETGQPFTGKAHGENKAIPVPDSTSFEMGTLDIHEFIDNAGITKQAMDKARGGTYSWGNMVEHSLAMLRTSVKNYANFAAIGDGTGRLARISACTSSPATTHAITCDNTYKDFGWDNVAMIRKGMHVDIYASDGTTLKLSDGKVTAVSKGLRTAELSWAAASGTCTITGTLENGQTLGDNDVIYLYDSINDMPYGLTGLVQKNGYFGSTTNTIFGLTRASFDSLIPVVTDAATNGARGTSGVPDDWDVTVFTDVMQTIWDNSGGELEPTHWLMNSRLAMAIARLGGASTVVSVSSQNAALTQPVVGDRIATGLISPRGTVVPIICDPNIEPYMAFGLHKPDLRKFTKGPWDFLREYGDVWEPSRGNRYTNYEAPFGGYLQMGAYRLDNCALLLDLDYTMS